MRRTKPWPKGSLSKAPRWLVQDGRKWERRLGLTTWRVSYYVCNSSQSDAAETRWQDNYQEAAIAFDPDIFVSNVYDRAAIIEVLVHEQHHLLFAKMDAEMADLFGYGSSVFKVYSDQRETMCDVLAHLAIDRYKRASPTK